MNKQEAMKKLADTERELAELRAIIEAPESNQWKPEEAENFYKVNGSGRVGGAVNLKDYVPIQMMILNGNCFKTKEDAEKSLKYTIMNSEYDYWIPGVSQCKPDVEPKGSERWLSTATKWVTGNVDLSNWKNCIYRWKRSEQ